MMIILDWTRILLEPFAAPLKLIIGLSTALWVGARITHRLANGPTPRRSPDPDDDAAWIPEPLTHHHPTYRTRRSRFTRGTKWKK